jgi:hypothetical protein
MTAETNASPPAAERDRQLQPDLGAPTTLEPWKLQLIRFRR